ncbi:Putative lipoprotein-releasing system, ATP-binding protein, LolD-like [Desulfonema limicola]|uniref:Lipoprotein-releasing system, ATP-binding protein, LolD-like n=1 Tax=Desulfonema limicola TaxID=45656 RepID=A0A975GIG9_9BACT|nr:ABC transporter ATP-binding protein [Desulfonema limicola]QTA81943.1 Putative lipoprotein-releasing system, ATP-binding protein, LolD-like [Desulfonema limicola]
MDKTIIRKNNSDLFPLIDLKGICKGFDGSDERLDILRDLDFTIDKGESAAIVGASGIGKSTFLHIMGTLDRPDKGKMLFNNEDVFAFDNEKLAKFRNSSIGFVFQFHHLLPEFTAVENTMMPLLINGWKKKQAVETASELLKRVGLETRINHRVNELSGGEQQRVALARALVLKPLVLLADEPTGNLDKRNSEKIHELLSELNKEFHMTLVVVTHSTELAAYMSRSVTLLDGQLFETN